MNFKNISFVILVVLGVLGLRYAYTNPTASNLGVNSTLPQYDSASIVDGLLALADEDDRLVSIGRKIEQHELELFNLARESARFADTELQRGRIGDAYIHLKVAECYYTVLNDLGSIETTTVANLSPSYGKIRWDVSPEKSSKSQATNSIVVAAPETRPNVPGQGRSVDWRQSEKLVKSQAANINRAATQYTYNSSGHSLGQVRPNSYYDYNYRPPVGSHYVQPTVRADGTYVQGHWKTNSDDSFWNNWSSNGNLNPYTGATGAKTPPYVYSQGTTNVRGYYRNDGTYVRGYTRKK